MAISLASISKGQRIRPPRIVVYGVGGIGKTSFAAGAPKPIFIFTEAGQGTIDLDSFRPSDRPGDPCLRTWGEIIDALQALYNEKHDYQTVVIDSVDFAEPLLWNHICARDNMANVEAYGYGKGYMHAADEARKMLGWLDALCMMRNMTVILVVHSQIKKFDAPDTQSYERYILKLQERFAALVYDWSDACLFMNWRTYIVKDKDGPKTERVRGAGGGERVLYSEERPGFWAKNHYDLPEEMTIPELDQIPWLLLQRGIAASYASKAIKANAVNAANAANAAATTLPVIGIDPSSASPSNWSTTPRDVAKSLAVIPVAEQQSATAQAKDTSNKKSNKANASELVSATATEKGEAANG